MSVSLRPFSSRRRVCSASTTLPRPSSLSQRYPYGRAWTFSWRSCEPSCLHYRTCQAHSSSIHSIVLLPLRGQCPRLDSSRPAKFVRFVLRCGWTLCWTFCANPLVILFLLLSLSEAVLWHTISVHECNVIASGVVVSALSVWWFLVEWTDLKVHWKRPHRVWTMRRRFDLLRGSLEDRLGLSAWQS